MTDTRSLLLFGAAVAVLFVAHVFRAARHSYLFARGELPERFDLLLGLSLAYALNTLVPWRVGELVRVLFIALRLRLRVPHVAATVAAERLSDVVVVAGITAAMAAAAPSRGGRAAMLAMLLAAVALGIVAAAVLVQRVSAVRRLVWYVASVFNDRIKLGLVEFVWSVAHLVTEGPFFTARYLGATLGMWALYLTAFRLFAAAVGLSLPEVSDALLGAPLTPLLTELFAGGASRAGVALLLFTAVPVGVVIAYGLVRDRRRIGRSVQFARRFGLAPAELSRPPVSSRFRNSSDYGVLLLAHFTATNQIVTAFAAEGLDDAVVHRLLPGGSDAVTAVVEVGGALSIRKLAAGGAGKKLGVQAEWLRRHGGALPLPAVLGERQYGDKYHYDMPYHLSAHDFYDVIHTSPLESSARVLGAVVDAVDAFHRAQARGDAGQDTVDAYLEQKVQANARAVLDYARLMVGDEFTINGEPHRLADWACLLDLDWLRAQVPSRATATIHGDLTVENIIVCPDRPRGWYIIDPNPDNVFNTPLIDWAKLMQSLHLGYEGLNRGAASRVREGAVEVAFTRSSAYAQLHAFLGRRLGERLGAAGMREVAFHELVNYLRLTPYKLRHAPQKGTAFFACTAVLLRRYQEAGRAEADAAAPARVPAAPASSEIAHA